MAESMWLEPTSRGWRLRLERFDSLELEEPAALVAVAYAWLAEDEERTLLLTYEDGAVESLNAERLAAWPEAE